MRMIIIRVHILVRRINAVEYVSAVQDSFGPEYRCLERAHQAGWIGEVIIREQEDDRATGEDGTSRHRFQVVKPVHANTVRGVLRRHRPRLTLSLAAGRWHEVHSE